VEDGGVRVLIGLNKVYRRFRWLVLTTIVVVGAVAIFSVHRATCKVDPNEMIHLAASDPDTRGLGPDQSANGEKIDWTKPILEQAPGCCRIVRTRRPMPEDLNDYLAYYEVEFLRSDEEVKELHDNYMKRWGPDHYLNPEHFRVYGVGVFTKCGELLEVGYAGG
jgi:hypothetical protein